MEEFRDLQGFENYQISSLGRIYSKKRRTFLKVKRLAGANKDRQYYQVRLSKDGIYVYKNLHRILAETFIPNPNNYRTVNHINGNKLDNRLENLEWADDCKLLHEACLLGLKPVTQHILTREEIIEVYRLHSEGLGYRTIAKKFNTRPQLILKLIKGQRHKNLYRQYRDKFNL